MAVEASASASLWSTFTAKAELLGAAVMRTSSQETAASLLREAANGFVCTDSVAVRYPVLAAAGMKRTKAPASEVVAPGTLAVAETGSVLLDEAPDDRGTCFLAERLWLLVPEDEIVPNLDKALEQIETLIKSGSKHPVLMSGPSRTADIERILTIGVHGPRALVVVVVGKN